MTVRWRARWMMSSTQAVLQRLAAALSPAVGPMMWMQVGRLISPYLILFVLGRGAISIQICILHELYIGKITICVHQIGNID